MEKSATNVLLQLIDCIESLKNEVKRKMNVVWRVVLYQSHTEINSQEENSGFASSKASAREIFTVPIPQCFVARVFIMGSAGILRQRSGYAELDPFCLPRIYNQSCETFAGA